MEELLSISPHPRSLAILECEQRLLETLTKGLTSLARKHGRKVVDADDGKGEVVLIVLDLDRDGGVLEGGVDGVDGDGVVRVCGVARNVDDYSEVATLLGEEFLVDERGDGLGEVDGVEEDISLRNFLVRA
jgi:hypothetical protein